MEEIPGFRKSWAVVVGINKYQHVRELRTATCDALVMAHLLRYKFGYELLPGRKPLLDGAATCDEIKTLFTQTLRDKVQPDDRLLVYFAGHGATQDKPLGPSLGFILPQDAKRDQADSMIETVTLREWLENLKCRHLLVILDCCFAGTFASGPAVGSTRDSGEEDEGPQRSAPPVSLQRYTQYVSKQAWHILASCSPKQTSADWLVDPNLGLYIGDRGKSDSSRELVSRHSPFAAALIEGLRGSADTRLIQPDGSVGQHGDMVVTAPELYAYLTNNDNLLRGQTPSLDAFPSKSNEGIFVFTPAPDDKPLKFVLPAPPPKLEDNPYMGSKPYSGADQRHMFVGRTRTIAALARVLLPRGGGGEDGEGEVAAPSVAPLTFVLGSQYAGKTSLLRAGVMPFLVRQGHTAIYCSLGSKLSLQEQLASHPALPIASVNSSLSDKIAEWKQTQPQGRGSSACFFLFLDSLEAGLEGGNGKLTPDVRHFLQSVNDALKEHGDRFRVVAVVRSDAEKAFFTPENPWYSEWVNKKVIQVASEDSPQAVQNIPVTNSPSENGPELPRPISCNYLRMPELTQDEIRRIIRIPATRLGLWFESDELVESIVNGVLGQPAAPLLLSMTLHDLFLHYMNRDPQRMMIALADLMGTGGVQGSLNRKASRFYEELGSSGRSEQQAMRDLFMRMVGEGLTLRKVRTVEFEHCDPPRHAAMQTALKHLGDEQLLICDSDERGDPCYTLAHDTLIRDWELMQIWLKESLAVHGTARAPEVKGTLHTLRLRLLPAYSRQRAQLDEMGPLEKWLTYYSYLPLRIRLTRSALMWFDDEAGEQFPSSPSFCVPTQQITGTSLGASKKRSGLLWDDSDPDLPNLERVAQADKERDQYYLNSVERAFLDATLAKRTKNRVDQRTRRIVGSVAALLLALLGVFAWLQRETALQQTAQAARKTRAQLAQAVAGNAQANSTNGDPQLGLLLAMESITITEQAQDPPVADALTAMHGALLTSPLRYLDVGSTDPLILHARIDGFRYSPDGRHIAVAKAQHGVYIADVSTGQVTGPIGRPARRVAVEYSPDGRYLAVLSDDVSLYDAAGTKKLKTLDVWGEADGPDVYLMQFTSDSKYFVTTNFYRDSAGSTVTLWDVDDLSQVDQVVVPEGIYGIIPRPRSEDLIITYADGALLWRRGTQPTPLDSGLDYKALTFSPDGSYVAVQEGTYVRIRNFPEGTIVGRSAYDLFSTNPGDPEPLISLAFTPDGEQLIALSPAPLDPNDPKNLWIDVNVASKRSWLQPEWQWQKSAFSLRIGTVDVCAVSPSGDTIAAANQESVIFLYDWSLPREQHPYLWDASGEVQKADFGPKSGDLLTVSAHTDYIGDPITVITKRFVKIWDAETNTLKYALPDYYQDAFYNRKLDRLLAFKTDGAIDVLDDDTYAPISTVHLLDESGTPMPAITGFAGLSPDGKHLIANVSDVRLGVWSAITGKLETKLDDPVPPPPDGGLVQPSTSTTISALFAPPPAPRVSDTIEAIVSPDGDHLATISSIRRGNTLTLWDVDWQAITLEQNTIFPQLTRIQSAEFSPDGRFLVLAFAGLPYDQPLPHSTDVAELWDVKLGHSVGSFVGSDYDIDYVHFDPSGEYVITGGQEGAITVWNTASLKQVFAVPVGDSVSANLSADGEVLLAVSRGGSVQQYVADARQLWQIASTRVGRVLIDKERARYLGEPLTLGGTPTPISDELERDLPEEATPSPAINGP